MNRYRLHVLVLPVLLVGLFQLTGCSRQRAIPPPPPGGTYRSITAGATFQQSVSIANLEGSYIATLPLREIHRPAHARDMVYIAAGGAGIVVSEDDGVTWNVIATPLTSTLDVVAMPNGVLVASGVDGAGQGFIIRSLDAGSTWEDVLTIPIAMQKKKLKLLGDGGQPAASIVISIELDPFNGDRIYAGSNLGTLFVGEQSAKVWRSLHTVGGKAPSAAGSVGKLKPSPHRAGEVFVVTGAGQLLRVEGEEEERIVVPQMVSSTPSAGRGERVVFDVSFVPGYPEALVVSVGDGVVVTRDGGKSWFRLNIPIEATQDFNTVIAQVSPTNPDRILVAINSVIYRSEDGGQTWITVALGLPNFVITDLSINPANAAKVLIVVRPLVV